MPQSRKGTRSIDKWRISLNFLSKDEEKLIKKCAAGTRSHPTTLFISELGRVGKSGARLLLCYLGRKSIPFVIKIDKKEKISKEYKAISRIWTYFKDAGTPSHEPAYVHGLGALLYWHRGGDTREQIEISKELRDIVFEMNDPSITDHFIEHVMKQVLSHLDAAQHAKKLRRFQMREEYQPYLRGHKSATQLKALFGAQHNEDYFEFLGAQILNPLTYIKDHRLGNEVKGYFCPIHGDLHANNVIVDSNNGVHLIDFAWAHPHKHFLKDFVLMECSLRFMLFPRCVDLQEQLVVDNVLLKPEGALELAEWRSKSILAPYYRRLGTVLSVIRNQAMPSLNDASTGEFFEYLAAQFMVLYGLMRYDDYNRFTAVRALGLIAKKLSANNFGGSVIVEKSPEEAQA